MVEPVPSHAAEDEPERPDDDNPRGAPGSSGSSETESSESGSEGTKPRARRSKHKFKQKKQRSFWKELPILIVVALVLAFLIQQFLARVYMIPSGSMEETLHGCTGCTPDRILVDKITYDFADPSPGDVIVFRGPEPWVQNEAPTQQSGNAVARFFQSVGSVFGLAPPDERDFVKRIIATGGQTVACCDDQNRVTVDNKPLDEPYIHWVGEPVQEKFGPVKVPDDSVWVMGDNRNNSLDSRYQGLEGQPATGAVPVENIIGKARFIVLPPSRWGTISDHNPQQSSTVEALGAPAWQQGLPLGVGALAAWPTLWVGRGVGTAVVRTARRGR